MAKPSLQPIYQRLNSVPRYHPMTANTFADWAMEAGDMVTVTEGNKSYAAPVHTMTVKWHGKQEVVISSEGSKERSPVSKISQQKYNAGRGGGSYRGSQQLYYEMESDDGLLHATISATAERLTTEYRETVDDVEDALTGKIEQTARSLTSTYDNKIANVRSQIKQEADRISLVVEGTGANAKIKPASIVAAINGGTSSIKISADKIDLDGLVARLESKSIISKSVTALNTLYVGSGVGYGSLYNWGRYYINVGGTQREMKVYDADKSSNGNTLYIYKTDGTRLDFNKAVSLSGAWDGGQYSVTATAGTISGTVPRTTLYDLGLGTAAKGSGNTVTATYDIGYATVVSGQQRRGGSTGKKGTLSLSVGNLLQSKYTDSNGTISPDSGYLGLSSVVVDVPTSSYSNSITLTRESMTTETAGGVRIYKFTYYVKKNSASDPFGISDGGTQRVHW